MPRSICAEAPVFMETFNQVALIEQSTFYRGRVRVSSAQDSRRVRKLDVIDGRKSTHVTLMSQNALIFIFHLEDSRRVLFIARVRSFVVAACEVYNPKVLIAEWSGQVEPGVPHANQVRTDYIRK
ncbi:hypothetical protein DPSP01_000201 [Paraphaeosphaeria sporulosa]